MKSTTVHLALLHPACLEESFTIELVLSCKRKCAIHLRIPRQTRVHKRAACLTISYPKGKHCAMPSGRNFLDSVQERGLGYLDSQVQWKVHTSTVCRYTDPEAWSDVSG